MINISQKNILIIAGEPSGDIRGAELLHELKNSLPETVFWGIGGDRMQAEGMELTEHIRNLSIIGVWEAIKKIPKIFSQYKECTKEIQKRSPDVAILIDYPGFNLKIAKYLNKQKIPVVYYIIPQVWAWGRNRVKLLQRYVDKALVLFEFEERFLRDYGVTSEFVGHPLAEISLASSHENKRSNAFTISLLPGSRESEVKKLLPPMLGAIRIISAKRDHKPGVALAKSSQVSDALYTAILAEYADLDVTFVTDDSFQALTNSDFAFVASGTATLEAAIAGTPFVILYKVSLLTEILGRLFADTRFIGLVNVIAEKEIVPELLQRDASPEKVAKTTLAILEDATRTDTMKDELRKVKLVLGEPGAARRAAVAISEWLLAHSAH